MTGPSSSGGRGGWRDTPARAAPRNQQVDTGGGDGPQAPVMARSRVQLASTYAPGVLFTWEGARGICRSVPIDRPATGIEEATRALIFDGIREIAKNWLDRATSIRPPGEVPTQLALDDPFYNSASQLVDADLSHAFQLTDPGAVGYVPYPLLYRCSTCGHLIEYESIADQDKHPLPATCNGHDARWTQVDVVFVHWSGGLEPLSPYRYRFDPARGMVHRLDSCTCGAKDFKLKNSSSVFSEWAFVCEACGSKRDLTQRDPMTLEVLEGVQLSGGRSFQVVEANMLPISYRANNAFYPQKGSIIEFRDRSVVELLVPESRADLLRRIAAIHSFSYSEPTDHEIQAALTNAGKPEQWSDYQGLAGFAAQEEARGNAPRVEKVRREMRDLKQSWFDVGLVNQGSVQSQALLAAVDARRDWARRFDPLRLTVEHDRFRVEHIIERKLRNEAVDVMSPDRLICDAVGDAEALARYQASVGTSLTRLGVREIVLIRGLPICEFSFGFTRVSSTPVYQRELRNQRIDMPVRLNAFPELPVRPSKRPVYVTQQKNEALYFQLDEARVIRWLEANGVPPALPNSGASLGAAYLEAYADFRPFLDDFKDREGQGGTTRSVPSLIYMLLHSFAHQVMHSLADASGLDRDGLGEYLFPADLAFVVYRKGMTPDLGNISAMWRNNCTEFLQRIVDPRLLRCGSGNLCDVRGGACPACIMVSEVTCIGGNQLLTRATLKGGPAPNWEPNGSQPLIGYFDPRFAP